MEEDRKLRDRDGMDELNRGQGKGFVYADESFRLIVFSPNKTGVEKEDAP